VSQLNVDTIKKADGTGNLSVPAETGTVVTTASPSLGRRNIIINGAMQVAQRGTSETGVTTSGYTTVDRFSTTLSNIGTYTISQSTDAPDGFSNSFKIDCTTADASPASTDVLIFRHRIEAQDCQHLKFGTSGAQSLTLSFWVKSNKTGNANVIFKQPDANRVIGGQYTISSANTWEHKTITVSGDTSGTINNDNGEGIQLDFWLDSGSDYTGGTLPTAWETNNNADLNAGNTINIADNTANEWLITGVQLEVGSVATPFEHRSYGEELIACQRYYYNSHEDGDFSDYNGQQVVFAAGSTTFGASVTVTTGREHPTTMRASPTVTLYHQDGTSGAVYAVHNAAKITGVTAFGPTRKGFLYGYKANGFNQGYGYYFGYTADAEL
jgi:hypothetical protein